MNMVEVYTRPWCGFCSRVKRLLNSKNIIFTEIDVGRNPELKQTMIEAVVVSTSLIPLPK